MIEQIKARLASKTYRTALVLAIITAVEINSQFLSSFIPPTYRQWAIFVWPVAMLTLRELTTAALA